MRAVVTRVKNASVTIDGKVNGEIGQGFLVLLGVAPSDTEAQAFKLTTAAMTATIPTSMMIPWIKSLMAVAIYPPSITYRAVNTAIAMTHHV